MVEIRPADALVVDDDVAVFGHVELRKKVARKSDIAVFVSYDGDGVLCCLHMSFSFRELDTAPNSIWRCEHRKKYGRVEASELKVNIVHTSLRECLQPAELFQFRLLSLVKEEDI